MSEEQLTRFAQTIDMVIRTRNHGIEYLRTSNPSSYSALREIDIIMRRSRKHGHRVSGLLPKQTLLTDCDPNGGIPDFEDAIYEARTQATHRGNLYFNLAYWRAAEEYYKLAISLASMHNDAISAGQNAANLALVYAATNEVRSGTQLAMETLSFAANSHHAHLHSSVRLQAATIMRIACCRAAALDLVTPDATWFREHYPQGNPVDRGVFTSIREALTRRGALKELEQWNKLEGEFNMAIHFTSDLLKRMGL